MTRPLKADFHTHSTASDGTLAPEELVVASAHRGLSHIALTDHDTTGGLAEASAAGHEHGVVVIPGLEFSAQVDAGELHILGYAIDHEHAELQRTIEALRMSRMGRAGRILDKLDDLGIHIDRGILVQDSDDSVGRPHIARALVEAGVVASVGEAFNRYLGSDKPAFVDKDLIDPLKAIPLIEAAGGFAVMAHPLSVPDVRAILPGLIEAGLVGLECYYGEYDEHQHLELSGLAAEFGLLITGGSDFHGPAFKEGRDLGSVDIPTDVVRGMLERAGL